MVKGLRGVHEAPRPWALVELQVIVRIVPAQGALAGPLGQWLQRVGLLRLSDERETGTIC